MRDDAPMKHDTKQDVLMITGAVAILAAIGAVMTALNWW